MKRTLPVLPCDSRWCLIGLAALLGSAFLPALAVAQSGDLTASGASAPGLPRAEPNDHRRAAGRMVDGELVVGPMSRPRTAGPCWSSSACG